MEEFDITETRITGTKMNYLFVCKRKLWLFHHHIQMEHTSEYVDLGRLLHEDSYPRQKREIVVDELIHIDFIDKDGVLHDVKSGQSMEKAHEMQILYYLYILKQKGLPNRKGMINYRRQRRTQEVELTPEAEKEIETAIQDIMIIASMPKPPDAEYMKLCKPCSYGELCWS